MCFFENVLLTPKLSEHSENYQLVLISRSTTYTIMVYIHRAGEMIYTWIASSQNLLSFKKYEKILKMTKMKCFTRDIGGRQFH